MDDKVQQLMQRVRRIEIKTRALSDNVFAGQYHSAFKGRGMSFAEVREYQPGDDVRDIDWNVSARFDRTYVKVYEEERELTDDAQDMSFTFGGWDELFDVIAEEQNPDFVVVANGRKGKCGCNLCDQITLCAFFRTELQGT